MCVNEASMLMPRHLLVLDFANVFCCCTTEYQGAAPEWGGRYTLGFTQKGHVIYEQVGTN